MQTDDEFERQEKENKFFRIIVALMPSGIFKLRYAVLALILVAAFKWGWPMIGGGADEAADGATVHVPKIKAEPMAYRVRPEDPGGMDVHHEDSTIYDSFADRNKPDSEDESGKIENLFETGKDEEPEEFPPSPKPIENAATEITDGQSGAEKASSNINEVVAKIQEPKFIKNLPAEDQNEKAQKPENSEPENQKTATLSREEPAAGVQTIKQPHYVQLGSVRNENRARFEWKRLLDELSAILPDDRHRIEKADLGSKGIYYRVQAGPYSKDQAKALCDRVKSLPEGGGCFVTAQ